MGRRRIWRLLREVLTLGLLVLAGCDCGGDVDNGRRFRAGADARAQGTDTGTTASDGGEAGDGGGPLDTGALDSGSPDSGDQLDSGAPFFFDAMTILDGGLLDSGSITPPDSGVVTPPDSGVVTPPDSGIFTPPDSGIFTPPDSGINPGAGDVWFEIDYSSANSPRSPSWRFSNTPGWGSSQWAAVNASSPEAWDRFNNMQVVSDPIGRSLEIGGGSELQVMIGLEELSGYDSATVHIEGRSRATSSSVDFDVYNPWNGCGGAARFGQQWQVQSADVDLMSCYEVGQGVQAVRVAPTNGTVALVRLRLTLHNARY